MRPPSHRRTSLKMAQTGFRTTFFLTASVIILPPKPSKADGNPRGIYGSEHVHINQISPLMAWLHGRTVYWFQGSLLRRDSSCWTQRTPQADIITGHFLPGISRNMTAGRNLPRKTLSTNYNVSDDQPSFALGFCLIHAHTESILHLDCYGLSANRRLVCSTVVAGDNTPP